MQLKMFTHKMQIYPKHLLSIFVYLHYIYCHHVYTEERKNTKFTSKFIYTQRQSQQNWISVNNNNAFCKPSCTHCRKLKMCCYIH